MKQSNKSITSLRRERMKGGLQKQVKADEYVKTFKK